jgi:hypothetical protein
MRRVITASGTLSPPRRANSPLEDRSTVVRDQIDAEGAIFVLIRVGEQSNRGIIDNLVERRTVIVIMVPTCAIEAGMAAANSEVVEGFRISRSHVWL